MVPSEAQSDDQLKYHTIDEDEAEALRQTESDPAELEQLEEKIKGLGNQTRLRILSYLSQKDLCVHDLTALLEMTQSAVSHQLKELRNLGLLSRRKEGRVVYYSLDTEALKTISDKLTTFLNL